MIARFVDQLSQDVSFGSCAMMRTDFLLRLRVSILKPYIGKGKGPRHAYNQASASKHLHASVCSQVTAQ